MKTQRTTKWSVFFITLLSAFLLTACSEDDKGTTPLDNGNGILHPNCVGCNGLTQSYLKATSVVNAASGSMQMGFELFGEVSGFSSLYNNYAVGGPLAGTARLQTYSPVMCNDGITVGIPAGVTLSFTTVQAGIYSPMSVPGLQGLEMQSGSIGFSFINNFFNSISAAQNSVVFLGQTYSTTMYGDVDIYLGNVFCKRVFFEAP